MTFIKELIVKVLELWLWVITTALASLSTKHKHDLAHQDDVQRNPSPPALNPDREEPIINSDDEDSGKEDKPEENKEKPKFEINKKDITDKETGELIETRVMVHILDEELRTWLRDETGLDVFYELAPKVQAHELLVFLPQFKEFMRDDKSHVAYTLLQWLEEEFGPIAAKIEAMLAENKITYSTVWYLFKKGAKFYGWDEASGCKIGSEVISFEYKSTMFFSFFQIVGQVVQSNGGQFVNHTKQFRIMEFKGAKKLSDLPVVPMDDETLKALTARGEKFRDLAIVSIVTPWMRVSNARQGNHYRQFKGALFRQSWFNLTYFKADGRIMLDGASFRRMNPNYNHQDFVSGGRNSNYVDHLSDQALFMCWPTLLGFSFSAKKWGELNVDNITGIEFDDGAFDRLVLSAEKKELIRALVENQDKTFADIISGKGGGCIFLLHGSPGVGKTLTAEAIAELLHRPLYSVSVGELGTNTQELEDKLREILEVASTWKAVVLLDEADIFLERRTEQDIKRNAMVGIFLRLLEYHQGVLFLTTNRVKSFDSAFHSRISVALKYDDLNEDARAQIWQTFFDYTHIKSINISDLAKFDLNGRQIKNAVRLAQALAKKEDGVVTDALIKHTIAVAQQFQNDVTLPQESPAVN